MTSSLTARYDSPGLINSKNMLSTYHRVIYVTTASLVVLASSVEAKGKGGNSSSQKMKKPIVTGGGGGKTCYDDEFVHQPRLVVLFLWFRSVGTKSLVRSQRPR